MLGVCVCCYVCVAMCVSVVFVCDRYQWLSNNTLCLCDCLCVYDICHELTPISVYNQFCCVSVYLCICLSVYQCVYVSENLFICVSVHLYLCVSVYLCVYVSVCLCLYICVLVYLCISVSVCIQIGLDYSTKNNQDWIINPRLSKVV